ncbi:MAG: carboxymuconolactone decarboxylase family protein [Croceibacterium sp.]
MHDKKQELPVSRLQPLALEDLGELQPAFAVFKNRMGFIANSGLIMARRPAILHALAGVSKAILEDGAVSLALKNCICQVASWATGCRYCQAHFANNVVRSGVADEKLENLWDYERSLLFSDAERAALRFAAVASAVPNGVTDEVFDELKAHWDDGQIVEILATCCYVGFLNRWNDSLATTLEDIPAAAGEKHLQSTSWSAGKHG